MSSGSTSPPAQHLRQIPPRRRALHLRHLLRRPLCDEPAPTGAALWAQVDDVIGGLDHVQVVLDDDDRVARLDQAREHAEQLLHVVEVQARGGLVQDVDGLAGGAARELSGQLDALRFTAGERG